MKHYGIVNPEGDVITNITVPSGSSFPNNPSLGELFVLTTGSPPDSQLYVSDGTDWHQVLIPVGEQSLESLRIGDINSDNMTLDPNAIQAYSSGSPTTLDLNPDGGTVRFGFDSASSLNILNGGNIRIYDASDTDYIQISHNGTDAVFDFANTTTLSISSSVTVPQMLIQANAPGIRLIEQDQDEDETRWGITANSKNFILRTFSDDEGSSDNFLTVVRGTGINVDSLALAADAITLNGVNITDYARVSQSNVFTASQAVSSTVPTIRLHETDADTNMQQTRIASNGGTFQIISRNDADNTTLATLFSASRSSDGTWNNVNLFGNAILLNGVNVTDFARKSQISAFTASGGGTGSAVRVVAGSPFLNLYETDGGSDEKNWDFGVVGETFRMRALTDADGSANSFFVATRGTGVAIASIELAATTLSFQGAMNFTSTPNTSAAEVGYKGVPTQDVNNTTYALEAKDAGTSIWLTGGECTIRLTTALPSGSAVTIIGWATSATHTIDATTNSQTLYWMDGNDFATTGNRTLASDAVVTLIYRGSNTWVINGSGLS